MRISDWSSDVCSSDLQLLHRVLRHHLVLVALNDQAGGGAGGEEAEVVHVGRRRHRDEAVDLRPAHQELHADPGAEGEAGDPARLGVVVVGLQPVRSEEHTSELQSLMRISYAVFCLKKKKKHK